ALHGGELARFVQPLQQQDGMDETGLAQRHRFGKATDGKTVGGGQCPCRWQQPMAVGVRLNNRHYTAAGRATASNLKIMTQGGEVDERSGIATHSYTSPL